MVTKLYLQMSKSSLQFFHLRVAESIESDIHIRTLVRCVLGVKHIKIKKSIFTRQIGLVIKDIVIRKIRLQENSAFLAISIIRVKSVLFIFHLKSLLKTSKC